MKVLISLLLFVLLPLTTWAQDYYQILGIAKDATDKEIKSAYRQLSKKFHPDKNPGNEDAHQKFIEVGEAYEVLSDPQKRQTFDQFGADAVKNGGQGQPGGGAQFHDPFDIFEQMFGGQGGGGNPFGGQRQKPRGPNIMAREEISLKDYYTGYELNFTLNVNDLCDHCHGTGSDDGKLTPCPDCQGRGVIIQLIRMGMMTQQIQQMCGRCGGKGQLFKKQCRKCHGNKVMPQKKEFQVKLPKGAKRHYMDAVSYTHLDVYKRQVLGLSNSLRLLAVNFWYIGFALQNNKQV